MQTPDSFIEIDGQRFEIRSAELELYHCSSPCADWNLTLLILHRSPLYLGGTVEPCPKEVADLDGARLRLELRDIDSVFQELLGVVITHCPLIDGVACAPVFFEAKQLGEGILLTAVYRFDWERALGEEGATYFEPSSARLQILGRVVALHAGGLP